MHWILMYVIAYAIYCVLPFGVEIILIIINMSIPDPVPFLDEILMILPTIKKIHTILIVKDAIERYPILKYLAIVSLIAIIGGIIYLGYMIFTQ